MVKFGGFPDSKSDRLLVAGLMVACTLLLGGVLFHAHANMVAAQDAMEEVLSLIHI